MTEKCILFTRPDGNVSVIHPAPGARLVKKILTRTDAEILTEWNLAPPVPLDRLKAAKRLAQSSIEGVAGARMEIKYAETEDAFVARVKAKDVPGDAVDVRTTGKGNLPDRRFRDAWRRNSTGLPRVDMPAARVVHQNHIRRSAQAKIKALSEDHTIKVARGDEEAATAIQTEIRRLDTVDVDTDLSGAATPDELHAIWPSDLPRGV